MTRFVSVLAATVLLATLATAAEAAGMRRVRPGHAPVGTISRDIITPWYVGYHGGHYSYYRPDPLYLLRYVHAPRHVDDCWRWVPGDHLC